VPTSTVDALDAEGVVAGGGVVGPAAELQLSENAAITARADTTGSLESM